MIVKLLEICSNMQKVRYIFHYLIFFVMVIICILNCNGRRNVVNLQRI